MVGFVGETAVSLPAAVVYKGAGVDTAVPIPVPLLGCVNWWGGKRPFLALKLCSLTNKRFSLNSC